jgi:hypothetical protein
MKLKVVAAIVSNSMRSMNSDFIGSTTEYLDVMETGRMKPTYKISTMVIIHVKVFRNRKRKKASEDKWVKQFLIVSDKECDDRF